MGEPHPLSLGWWSSEPLLPRVARARDGVRMPDELASMWRAASHMMDCVLPSRNARNGICFIRAG